MDFTSFLNMSPKLPRTTRTVIVQKASAVGGAKPTYQYDAVLKDVPLTQPKDLKKGQLLVKLNAASYNHRDVRVCSDPSGARVLTCVGVVVDTQGTIPRH